jgi:twitching motility protein PilT
MRRAGALLDAWMEHLDAHDGSDLHLQVGSPPMARLEGELAPIPETEKLDEATVETIVRDLLTPTTKEKLARDRQVDFSFGWRTSARVRANAYYQRGSLSLALRRIPTRIPTADELGLPLHLQDLVLRPHGLILVTGPTGSGKSTSLAALVEKVNQARPAHILTLEDPIEYLHRNARSVVNQREIGDDVPDWHAGLRAALREDPDVLLVGEMRDLESIQATLTIAETGHLVMATLHTNDTAQAIDRIVDVFPADRRAQIQVQLSATLLGVVAQRLVPRIGGGMVAAFELMLGTPAVRNLVREGRTNQLRNAVATARQAGMQTLEHHLSELVVRGVVTYDDACAISLHPHEVAKPPADPTVQNPAPAAAGRGRRLVGR